MNIIARLEFELTYFEGIVQYFKHYAAETLFQIRLRQTWWLTRVSGEIFSAT